MATITSCSQQDKPVPPTTSGVSINLKVQERDGQEWNGQSINVYMLEKDTINNKVKIAKDGNGSPIFSNAKMTAPQSGNTGEAYLSGGGRKAYPTFGNFDFWAFSINNGEIGTPVVTLYKVSVPFTINGRQDILVGRANAIADTIGSNFSSKTNSSKSNFAKHVYSAYAARYGVQPSIKFTHLLSKINFSITTENQAVCDATTGVYVDSIKVYSKSKGTIYAAFTEPANLNTGIQQITWKSTSTSFFVKESNGEPISSQLPIYHNITNIGEPMYINAETSSHTIKVKLRNTNSKGKTTSKWISNQISLANEEKLKPGATYNACIKINSASSITVETTPVK